jgi:hypothetical protein
MHVQKLPTVSAVLVSLLCVAGAWCIALSIRHRINPDSAARLDAGMTLEQVVAILGAEPGIHSSDEKDKEVIYCNQKGAILWSGGSRAELKELLDNNHIDDKAIRLWISDDHVVIATFKDNRLCESGVWTRFVPPRTVVEIIRGFLHF